MAFSFLRLLYAIFSRFPDLSFATSVGIAGPRGKDSLNLRERSSAKRGLCDSPHFKAYKFSACLLPNHFVRILALATSVFAGERLNALVTAAQDFSVAIQEQLAAVQSDISATQLVEKTVSYAKAKTAYFNALRAEIPEMTDIATGRQPRPSDLDKFPAAFSVAGEKQEKAADKETLILLLCLLGCQEAPISG